MQTLKFETKEAWLEGRRGKITGSRAKDIMPKARGAGYKIGFYELIAERLAVVRDPGETPMDRGIRLEEEAIARFEKETGKKVDQSLVLWMRDDNPNIAVSPDGSVIGEQAAVEAKCLSSARHIEAFLTKELPDEFKHQRVQYFIVNEPLKDLYFLFYDPSLAVKDFFYFHITREEVQSEIKEYLEQQRKVLEEVETIVNKLTF